jgi:hypothetical protein
MNIPGKIASVVLILIGAGWLVSLFSPWSGNNNNGSGRATNNLGVTSTNPGLGINPATQNQSPVTANTMTTPLKTALPTGTPEQIAAAQAAAAQAAAVKPATPVPNQVAGATQTNQAVVAPGTGTQQFETAPRSATAPPVTPVVTPVTPAPAPITEPVRAGW